MSVEKEFKDLARALRQTGLSKERIISLISQDNEVPATIFANKTSPLKTLVSYLKKELDMELKDISVEIKRSYRAVWGAYSDIEIKFEPTRHYIPLDVFNDRLSVLESVSIYLKEKCGLRISRIAQLLNRKDSTIWTAYTRAKKKNDN